MNSKVLSPYAVISDGLNTNGLIPSALISDGFNANGLSLLNGSTHGP